MTEKITFNLDTQEREKVYEPFVISIGDRSMTMEDPANLDWQDLLTIDHPERFLELCMSDEDREFFESKKVEGWRFQLLIKAYRDHYGLGEPGNVRASRT